MALFAVGVEVVHDELDPIVRLELPVTRETARSATRWEERVTAFGAEEVLFVVGPVSQLRVFERDEAFVDDRRLAVITPRSEFLFTHGERKSIREGTKIDQGRGGGLPKETHTT